jgi:hypothetical protein
MNGTTHRGNQRVPTNSEGNAPEDLIQRTDAEFHKNLLVTLGITVFQVGKEATPLRNHCQKTSPGGMIFLVGLKVRLQLDKASTQHRNLNFG